VNRDIDNLLSEEYWPPELISLFEKSSSYKYINGYWDLNLSNIPIYRSELGISVFYDLREYCYPEEVTLDFITMHYSRNKEKLLQVIDKWDIKYLVLKKPVRPLVKVLGEKIKKVFEDDFAAVYALKI
jgi:hypothetical protein